MERDIPICVDLDGTLLKTDLLYESLLALLGLNPFYLFLLPLWLLKGKAAFKHEVASRVSLDVRTLPYDARVVELLKAIENRPRILCTASNVRLANHVADHLGIFDMVIASDDASNLSGRRKATLLAEKFGHQGFDYVGNAAVDLHVWRNARRGWVVNAPPRVAKNAAKLCDIERCLTPDRRRLEWLRGLRLHQWLKNLLVFLPLLASHRFIEPLSTAKSLGAFFAFGLCASGVYVFNDLLDLSSDRNHPRKRLRPFAAGNLSPLEGLVAGFILNALALCIAWAVSPLFLLVLIGYEALTLGYSLRLKRLVMVDVVVLAALYTVRIIAGAAAIGSKLSFWLLAFSMFLFFSLAILKRYTELMSMQARGSTYTSGRGYQVDDLALIQSLGGASGYISVLVLALYINSPESIALYSHPQLLWIFCPVLLYWISRTWIIAHRGAMHDDPVVFSATDRVSQLLIALCGVIAMAAT